jgi:hypothetical protein
MRRTTPLAVLALTLPLLSQACGERKAASDEESAAATSPAERPAQQPQPAATQASYVLTASDLDAYEKGMSRENELLRVSLQKLKAARSAGDTVGAMAQAQPQQTEPEGARAAGVPVDRYREIKAAVGDVLGRAEAAQMMQSQMGDTSGMDAATKAQMRANMAQAGAQADPYGGLPSDVASAFRSRQARLETLRAENVKALFAMAGR